MTADKLADFGISPFEGPKEGATTSMSSWGAAAADNISSTSSCGAAGADKPPPPPGLPPRVHKTDIVESMLESIAFQHKQLHAMVG